MSFFYSIDKEHNSVSIKGDLFDECLDRYKLNACTIDLNESLKLNKNKWNLEITKVPTVVQAFRIDFTKAGSPDSKQCNGYSIIIASYIKAIILTNVLISFKSFTLVENLP